MNIVSKTDDGVMIKFSPTEYIALQRVVKRSTTITRANFNLKEVEKITILDCLKHTGYHMSRAAKLLGFRRRATLRKRVNEYREQGIEIPIIKVGRKKRS